MNDHHHVFLWAVIWSFWLGSCSQDKVIRGLEMQIDRLEFEVLR